MHLIAPFHSSTEQRLIRFSVAEVQIESAICWEAYHTLGLRDDLLLNYLSWTVKIYAHNSLKIGFKSSRLIISHFTIIHPGRCSCITVIVVRFLWRSYELRPTELALSVLLFKDILRYAKIPSASIVQSFVLCDNQDEKFPITEYPASGNTGWWNFWTHHCS